MLWGVECRLLEKFELTLWRLDIVRLDSNEVWSFEDIERFVNEYGKIDRESIKNRIRHESGGFIISD
jgi:hypothetical protein